jgi:hypothetical protein
VRDSFEGDSSPEDDRDVVTLAALDADAVLEGSLE